MKIQFDLGDELPLNKTIESPIITIVIRTVFHENKKYYPQSFLDECLYELQKCNIMIELTFSKELMLIKQVHQKSVTFIIIGIS